MVRVTFLHPDLGIGGAERLIVDAALALKKSAHDVNIVTTYYDPERCFVETKDGTLSVIVVGNWLPRHIFGKFYALCAYIRMIYAAFCIFFIDKHPDIVVCDLVSICIPILKLFIRHTIFYCHHPDQLLTLPGGRLKSIYRLPLNYLEEITTGQADKIFVNSYYTAEVFKNTFKRLSVQPEILYPSIHTNFFDSIDIPSLENTLGNKKLPEDAIILLSINRYERKKNLSLAINSLFALSNLLTEDEFNRTYLIMIGGYDTRVQENVEHYEELIKLADELKISDKIIFLRSPSDHDKISLLKHCTLLIYTPPNEHFGIVPLEAMYLRKPVIAHDSGGPQETIINNTTGYLIPESSAEAFAEKISVLIKDKSLRDKFGNAGRDRVIRTFSFEAFMDQLNNTVIKLIE
ncbi:hypothetical protein PV327_010917 [Microctonus hyperodae]|uniref:Alpha-1,3/1,6-mannosyltransferase ALG2 n=1 Tax=Microctonus hyperodae TaxID=165561 RepID=A0AA39C8G2_MICHY|nr:hypothetical protein PV327_010917 [Microctonus hyperodae]